MRASICTPWIAELKSTPCASVPTDTGCALLLDPTSKSGILKTKPQLRTFTKMSLARVTTHPLASVWPGHPMDKPCLLDTQITSLGSGKCPLSDSVPSIGQIWFSIAYVTFSFLKDIVFFVYLYIYNLFKCMCFTFQNYHKEIDWYFYFHPLHNQVMCENRCLFWFLF